MLFILMLYYIRLDIDHGYHHPETLLNTGEQKWSLWFYNKYYYEIGYCHTHPTPNFKNNTYYHTALDRLVEL